MAPLAKIGKNNVRVTVKESRAFSSPSIGIFLLVLGALYLIGSVLTGLSRIQPNLGYASAVALSISALGMALKWRWALPLGRVSCWLNFFLFAMLVVPDWDDAIQTGSQDLHVVNGVIAGYFLLCAIALGFTKQPAKKVPEKNTEKKVLER